MSGGHIIIRWRSFAAITAAGWLLLAGTGGAQSLKNTTLPPYHWATEYLFEWQLRSVQKPLLAATLPWQFSQVYDAVSAGSPRTEYERFLRSRMMSDQQAYGLRSEPQQPFLHFGALFVERAGRMADELRSRLVFRFFSSAWISKNVQIFNSMTMDQNLGDDPDYLGKNWRGITAITEQAYTLVHFDRFSLKFGRDYIRWGRGYDGTLLISDASRPFDQLQLQFRTRLMQFSYFVSKLNSVLLSDTAAARLQKTWADRYLAAGRVDFAFFKRRLQFSVTQTVLWGGDRQLEWYYLNPFIFYHGEQLNEPQPLRANTMGAIDFVFYPTLGWEFYGQLLIDDIQVEKTGPGDLEPNEIGYLLGFQVADPGGWEGATIGLEYTRVANRTYNTLPEAEKYVHRNKPIGHFLGNDFDRWLLHGRQYLGRGMTLALKAEYRRHGEGRVNAPFDRPWMEYTVEEGYSEPFPTGIVEKTRLAELELRWHPRWDFFLSAHARYESVDNVNNVEGQTRNRFEFFIRLWWEVQQFFPL